MELNVINKVLPELRKSESWELFLQVLRLASESKLEYFTSSGFPLPSLLTIQQSQRYEDRGNYLTVDSNPTQDTFKVRMDHGSISI